jgi:hypothetical protein
MLKQTTECVEGPEAFMRFRDTMKKVLKVSPAELKRRIEAEHVVSAANPNRRGPKPRKEKP